MGGEAAGSRSLQQVRCARPRRERQVLDGDDPESGDQNGGERRVQAGVRRVQVDDADVRAEPPQHAPVHRHGPRVPELRRLLHERDVRCVASGRDGFGDLQVGRDDRDSKGERQAGEDRLEAAFCSSYRLCVGVRNEPGLSRHQPEFAIRE